MSDQAQTGAKKLTVDEASAVSIAELRGVDEQRAHRNAIWDADRISCNWAREHLNDPDFNDDPRWNLVWHNAIAAESLERELAPANSRRSQ